ncbi:MAG TPA: hypothetical protein VGD67_12320, partial [Pseudonocardiaceae bacterium]
MSIRTRVTLYGLGVVTLVLGLVSALFLALIAGTVPQNQDNELAARARAAVTAVEAADAGALVARPPLAVPDLADEERSAEFAV